MIGACAGVCEGRLLDVKWSLMYLNGVNSRGTPLRG